MVFVGFPQLTLKIIFITFVYLLKINICHLKWHVNGLLHIIWPSYMVTPVVSVIHSAWQSPSVTQYKSTIQTPAETWSLETTAATGILRSWQHFYPGGSLSTPIWHSGGGPEWEERSCRGSTARVELSHHQPAKSEVWQNIWASSHPPDLGHNCPAIGNTSHHHSVTQWAGGETNLLGTM